MNTNKTPPNPNASRRGESGNAPGFVIAIGGDSDWLESLSQACALLGLGLEFGHSAGSIVASIGAEETPLCLVIDRSDRQARSLDLERLMVEHGLALPVLVRAEQSSPRREDERAESSGPVIRTAHVLVPNDLDDGALTDRIEEVISMKSLAEHQFEVIECHRLVERLTDRQRQLIDSAVEGAPNKQIANRLKVSVKTIEAERQRAYRCLEVKSTAEMTRVVILARLYDIVFPIPQPVLNRRDRDDAGAASSGSHNATYRVDSGSSPIVPHSGTGLGTMDGAGHKV